MKKAAQKTARKTLKERRATARPGFDTPLFITVLVLVAFGLIMMFSASFASAYYYMGGDSLHYIRGQIIWAVIGLVAMLVISRIDYYILHKWAWFIMLLSLVLLALTLFMRPINGERRWLIIGSFTFQPSELVKFAVICLFSHQISVNQAGMRDFKYGYLQFMILLGVIAVIMLNQTHLSGTILILAIGFTLMLVGGTRPKYFLATAGIGAPLGLAFILLSDKMSYAADRIDMWLNPFGEHASQQTMQSLIAIGSGGLMGLGLGNSRQKHMYVPEAQNDFIFAIICEELGFIGAVFVIALFMFFIFRGLSVALNARDRFGALMAIGITVQIGLQALLNIAVVTNTVPNTGISLPFFSQGGSSLVLLLMEVGVLLSISRFSSKQRSL